MKIELGHLRFGRFMCWLLTGHIWDKTKSKRMMSREMNTCIYCAKYEAGPD